VLYEILTGKPPFKSESEQAVVYAILNEEPKPIVGKLQEDSAWIESVIAKCLQKDPARRYQSATELVNDLSSHQPITQLRFGETGRKSWTRMRSIVGLAVLGALIVAVASYLLFFRSTVRLVPNRVAVTVFDNRTSDASLDPLGTEIAERVAQGLAGIGVVVVVPSDVAIRIWRTMSLQSARTEMSDLLRVFGERTAANLIVSGSYYKERDSLRFHAKVTDGETGELVRVVGPVSAPTANRGEAIEVVRQRLMGGIASLFDARSPLYKEVQDHVPMYDAYHEHMVGSEVFESGGTEASIGYFIRAFKLDSTCFGALLSEALVHDVLGETTLRDSIADFLAKSRQRMSTPDALMLDWLQCIVRGDLATRVTVSRQLAAKYINVWSRQLGHDAHLLNFQREAIQALSQTFPPYRTWGGNSYWYWTDFATSYHLVGECEKELETARKGRADRPNLLSSYHTEMRALAALGRVNEVWKLFDEVCTLSAQSDFTPGRTMFVCAREFRFHGHREASQLAIQKAIDWYVSRPDSELQLRARQDGLAEAYYFAGNLEKAKTIYVRLNKLFPTDLTNIGFLGSIAARTGDTIIAQKTDDFLKNVNRPNLRGNHTWWRACIASSQGKKDKAVRLLRESLAQGQTFPRLHANSNLEPLWDYPPFQELVKPKE
jgi:tetratricopeptide (TPR) repeat protein